MMKPASCVLAVAVSAALLVRRLIIAPEVSQDTRFVDTADGRIRVPTSRLEESQNLLRSHQ